MNPLIQIARHAIRARLSGQPFSPAGLEPPWDRSRGVFVTLYEPGGALRGCIGHLSPVHASLADEIAECARSSAFEDPRFPPVAPEEADALQVEISLLEPAEPATRAELDPKRFGVIVTSGRRRGVLLPDIEGVTTVDQQLDIARRKAGIRPDEPYTIQRFAVTKVAGLVAS